MVEDHHLVDHRQLEMGVRVVERDAAFSARRTTNQLDDDEDDGRAAWRHAEREASRASMPESESDPEIRASASRPKKRAGSARHAKRDLARGPHALERRAGVEGGRRGEEAREREEVDEEDEVAGKRAPARAAAEREQQERRGDGRHDGEDRPGEEDPGRRAAQDGALAEELRRGRSRAEGAAARCARR